jgi:hypothetical protein
MIPDVRFNIMSVVRELLCTKQMMAFMLTVAFSLAVYHLGVNAVSSSHLVGVHRKWA